MKRELTKWMLAVALAVGGVAFATNKEVACKKDCEAINKACVDGCKKQVRKKAPQTEPYCAPKCKEVQVSCEKDCENENRKH